MDTARNFGQCFVAVLPSLPDAVNVQHQSGEESKNSLQHSEGVMIFAVGSSVTPWSPMVYACDSSLDGYSVQSSIWTVSDVRETGLRKEGGRWKLGAHGGSSAKP